MTKAEILSSDKEMLNAVDIAPVIGADPQVLRHLARLGKLGFESMCYGKRVKFLKSSFISYMGWI